MKTIILSLLAIFVSIGAFAQQSGDWCGIDQIMKKRFQESGMSIEEFTSGFYTGTQNAASFAAPRATYTVPVVVHVLHNNGNGNISEAQILDALDILTKDYSRQNSDTSNTRDTPEAPFKDHAAGLDIEFKLAKRDPNGNCTNGIVRVNTSVTDNASIQTEPHKYSNQGGSDAWPIDKYFNVWVVNDITNPDNPPGIITGGYAQYPDISSIWGFNPSTYGLTIRSDMMGSIEVAATSDGGVLTHEVGHCFGLAHIFMSTNWFNPNGCEYDDCNSSGDGICDTPPQQQEYYTCNLNLNSCNQIAAGSPYTVDVLDQIENYMSYNTCWNMFSQGQMDLMEYNLINDQYLSDLISPSNITWTQVNEPGQICQANFTASKQVVCAGTEVQFTDYSFFNPISWTWSVSPGTEGVDYVFVNSTTSTSQNPEIQFLSENVYSITLEVSDGSNSVSNTESNLITILPQADQLPFIEKFENIADLNATTKWSPILITGSETFEINNGFGHTGTRCVGINNFAQSGGSSELIAAPVDLSVLNPGAGDIVTLSFRYAYRKRTAVNDEWLRLYVSKDCGETWALRKTIHGSLLGDQTSSSSWQPSSQADWETVHVTNITETFMVDNFMYKFTFDGSGGNNIYLDNINIYAGSPSDDLVVGFDENELFTNFHLYPNPSDGELNLGFSSEISGNAIIEILDLFGKVVAQNSAEVISGNNQINVNTGMLSDGAYLINLNVDGAKITRRFIKQ